jgi:iron-sulfur cluster repair protein YtfE (RIC family)
MEADAEPDQALELGPTVAGRRGRFIDWLPSAYPPFHRDRSETRACPGRERRRDPQAAASVYRYYSVSLPLHEADEEDTVRPRLDPVAGERVRHALLAMADQHQGIYDFVERLMPLLQLVEQNPGALPQVGGEMCSLTSALDEIFRAHLELEEQVIFPAIRETLPESARAEMLVEMQQRRRQG